MYAVLLALQSPGELGEEEDISELQQQAVFLQQFWEEINHSVNATPSGSMLRDMARLDLEVTQVGVPDNSEEKVFNERKKAFLLPRLFSMISILPYSGWIWAVIV